MKRDGGTQWKYAQIGIELALFVLLGFAAGWKLDQKFGTSPWLLLGCSGLGMAAGFYSVFREIREDK